MALTSTKKYAITIAGQIDRINAASNLLATKVAAMGLKVPATTDVAPTTVAEGTTAANLPSVTATTKIEDVAAALSSSMAINTSTNRTPEHGVAETIYAGFYPSDFTVTSQGKHTSGKLDITTDTVLTGYEGWTADGTKVAGTMVNNGAVSTSVNMNASYTIPAGYHNGSGTVTGPTIKVQNVASLTAVNSDKSAVSSDDFGTSTKYSTAWVTITRYNTADSDIDVVRSVKIPAGYYENDITLTPKILDRTGAVESVLNYKDLSITGDLTFGSDQKAEFAPSDSGMDYFGTVLVDHGSVTTLTDGTARVTKSGWFNTGDTFGSAYGGLSNTSLSWRTSATSGKTYTPRNITAKESYIDIAAGKIADTYLKVTVRGVVGSLSAAITGDLTYKPEIGITSNGNVLIAKDDHGETLAATTAVPSKGFYVAVQSPTNTGSITATASNTLTQTGWIDTAFSNATKPATVGAELSDVTYIPIAEGYHTISALLDTLTSAYVEKGKTVIEKGHYYVKCDTTTGYLTASTRYIDLGAAASMMASGVTYDATNGKFIASASVSAGYTPGINNTITEFPVNKGNTFTVTRDGYNINANTYFNSQTTVSVSSVDGRLGDGATLSSGALTTTNKNANANITTTNGSSTATTTKLGDLTENTTFYATNDSTSNKKRYLTSFTVEVNDTITALLAI